MKAFISKYALSADVYELEGELIVDIFRPIGKGFAEAFWIGRDAHLTREAAIADAERRRDAEVERLGKRIIKLKAIKFK